MVTAGTRSVRDISEALVRYTRVISALICIGIFLLSPFHASEVAAAPSIKTVIPLKWSQDQPLPIPSLQSLIAGTTTQQQALDAIVAYYTAHQAELATIFQEDDETRVKAFYGMYLVHNAVPYGVVERYPTTLAEYIALPRSHCGVYSLAQGWIYSALGLRWRKIAVEKTWHGLDEVWVGDHWETFDSTSDVWANISVGELIAGVPRVSRLLYTPITDIHAPAVFRVHRADGWDVYALRNSLPHWGSSRYPHEWYVELTSG